MKFDEDKISDQKRLVRGEHLLCGRSLLRVRDSVHHKKWRILILAGGAPAGEIEAIRTLCPQAHITACDIDEKCLEKAIEAGADDIVHCDLSELLERPERWHGRKKGPPDVLYNLADFDLVDLDLCSNANPITREIFATYRLKLTRQGVFMATFSYGRDVEEMFIDALRRAVNHYNQNDARRYQAFFDHLEVEGIPRSVCGRLAYLFSLGQLDALHSIALYRGSSMPMCSLVFQKDKPSPELPSVLRVEPGDYELAVIYPESAGLYDCPQERIESLRRSFAAIKAAYTRRAQAA